MSALTLSTTTLAKACLILAGALAGAIAIIFILALRHPYDRILTVGPNGQMIPNYPLDMPVETDADVLEWAGKTAMETMTFGFSDYRLRWEQARPHFTESGFSALLEGFTKADYKARLIDNFASQTGGLTGSCVLINKGLQNNVVYSWQIQCPMSATVSIGPNNKPRLFNLELTVVRISPFVSLPAIGIDQWHER